MNSKINLPISCEIHKRKSNYVSNYDLPVASTPIRKLSGKGRMVVMIGAVTEDAELGYRKERRTGLQFRNDYDID